MKTTFRTPATSNSTNAVAVTVRLEKDNTRYASLITLIFLALITLVVASANAQQAISKVNTYNTAASYGASYNAIGAPNSPNSSNSYFYKYGTASQNTGDNQKRVSYIVVGADTLNFEKNASSWVKIRRVNNSTVNGNRCLLWVEKQSNATSSQVSVVNEYNDNMETVFDNNFLNQGTDNLFANQGDGNGNNNNIERLDVLFTGGIIPTETNKSGFSFFERGDDNVHDPFVVAPITQIDGNGNPTAYGSIMRITSAAYGNIPASTISYYIVRRDPTNETNLRMSTSGTQKIGGVFLSFQNLGITSGQKIYGYSIFAYDLPANATSADLVDYNNQTFFPRNTSAATQSGGIDLIALTGVFSAPAAIILPPTADNITVPSMRNSAGITAIAPLSATAASGTIDSYTVLTIPSAAQGTLYVCDGTNCTPVTAGQILTPAQINQLSFQPNHSFVGNVVFQYLATDSHNQTSNTATYTIPVIAASSGPLPVRLAYFAGNIQNKVVTLNWQTADEINSAYFEIQRSTNGNDFTPIATITAVGREGQIANYQQRDDLYFQMGNTIFYRLKMVDIDGKFKFSQVVSFRLDQKNNASVTAWPLPFTSQLNLSCTSTENTKAQVMIVSMDGKSMVNQACNVRKGQNNLIINQAQQLPAGTYVVKLAIGDEISTLKIVKQ